ncbi:MAG TPA: hypothetical protein VLD65_06110 [Anaerolineales bacterium]|nr:hypothetical protein [Anaerolineales bacterium]
MRLSLSMKLEGLVVETQVLQNASAEKVVEFADEALRIGKSVVEVVLELGIWIVSSLIRGFHHKK